MSAGPFDLAHRFALVTGAGSGIGRATALLLDSMGAVVIATDVNEATASETAADFTSGGIALHHDVTSEADWAATVSEVARRFGKLNILVNNAGVMINCPFESMTLEILHRQMRINVDSVFLGMKAAMPLLEQSAGKASIINLSSIYGQVAGAKFSAYSASKGAVLMMTKAVANEYATRGVRANSVHPGPTRTNLSADWEPVRGPDGKLIPVEVAMAAWVNAIPMRRFGDAADIAGMIAFLASDAASYITGAELIVDGGYTIV